MKDRYSIAVGLIFLALIAVVTVRTLTGGGDGGTLGIDRLEEHWPLPEFAVPDAAGSLEGDANIAQDDCEVGAVPCPEDDRRTPACAIDTPGALRVCDYFDRPLVLSFWFEDGRCEDQQDVVSTVARRYGGRVNFLSITIKGSRDEVREAATRRDWVMPVGYDRDGAVAGLYRIGVCPTFAYAYPGGTLESASIGELGADGLSARVDRLLAATRAAEAG